MNFKRLLALGLLAALLTSLAPTRPALGDQAAVWRNLFIVGAGAATIVTINHNKQVHAKYAAYDQRVASLSAERNDAWAAYRSEKAAYEHEVAVSQALEHEVSYQHGIIQQMRRQLAVNDTRSGSFVATTVRKEKRANQTRQVAAISYGWGTI